MDADNPLRANPSFHEEGWAGYSRLFSKGACDCRLRVEATTHYFYQQTALSVLSQLEGAHVCVVLRDPAERVWSSFNFTQNNLARVPAKVSFEDYLEQVFEGKDLFPEICNDQKSAYVLERDVIYGEYARYLHAWMDQLGEDRVHVVFFEELKNRPQETLKQLLTNFDINTSWFNNFEFTASNRTYSVAHQGLHRFARSVNQALQESTVIKTILKALYLRMLRKTNKKSSRVPQAAIEGLRKYYEPHNKALEAMLSVELSEWMPQSSNIIEDY